MVMATSICDWYFIIGSNLGARGEGGEVVVNVAKKQALDLTCYIETTHTLQ